MSIPICTLATSMSCPHGGRVILSTSNTAASADGALMLLESDQHTVAGCPFVVGNKPQPCATVRWAAAATKVKVRGSGVLLQTSTGLCYSAEQIPQGTAVVSSVQRKAKGL